MLVSLNRRQEALDQQLEVLRVRRAPLGADRLGARYWWGLAAARAVVWVEAPPPAAIQKPADVATPGKQGASSTQRGGPQLMRLGETGPTPQQPLSPLQEGAAAQQWLQQQQQQRQHQAPQQQGMGCDLDQRLRLQGQLAALQRQHGVAPAHQQMQMVTPLCLPPRFAYTMRSPCMVRILPRNMIWGGADMGRPHC